ncbi:putative ABC transport system ATP-binding protein [Streptomyces griseochromogenes]|uniref:ABC transport system ATP-binding protein n=1 Tax=Streptomyces griseochromogenes TaxID=68214 RepID=A0A1B1BD63_9ACTN|nr:ABC transporter ATP-binding protein [Streptomyces griseochromogenes]ANP56764.1 peptide ABC transporter ATP-binding protein [Streptomyces griseochromogenes]MBP2055260.1 putative ABC transport system ATP-binding protein [Streptomyces griseochromogenes]
MIATSLTRVTVEARGVAKVYPTSGGADGAGVQALRGVDLDIDQGAFLAVMGPSGSGKSTLMHCLAGLDRPTSGTITIEDTEITALSERRRTDLRRDRIGFVFQQYHLLSELNGSENILLPLQIAGRRPDPAWLEAVVDALRIRDQLCRRPSELSGGQQQRVGIARALAARPAVVFADEPTGNLDAASGRDVLEFLRYSTREFDQTVVMVTHDPVAAAYADRVVLLLDGQISGELRAPTPESVLGALQELRR